MHRSRDFKPGLVRRQAELVAALVGGDPPARFDPDDVAAAQRSLSLKRLREVRLAWPSLCQTLEPEFDGRFLSYARKHPPPREGAIADGLAFSQHLRRHDELPDSARLELLAFNTRWRIRHGRVVPRGGLVLRIAALDRPRRVVVVLSARWIGEHWLELGPGRRTPSVARS